MISMNTEDITITIPAAIAAVPDLTLAERVALAFIHDHPVSSNLALAHLLGISVRGVEDLLSRLRQKNLIQRDGKGRAREHRLTFPVQSHTKCGNAETTSSHAKRGHLEVVPGRNALNAVPEVDGSVIRTSSNQDFVGRCLEFYANCIEMGRYDSARNHLQTIRQRIENIPELAPGTKAELLAKLTMDENRTLALQLGAEIAQNRSGDEQRQLALTICRASGEQLARFRQLHDASAALGDTLGVLAIQMG
jgi:hypothetical protein